MWKDKGVVVANPARGMDHAYALESAVRGGAFMPRGGGRSEVRPKAGREDAFGTWQIPRHCFRRALARSTLAAALASLLPLYSATAQETQVQDARVADPPAEEGRADGDPTQLDTVQVTGTRIKGGSVPSPVITIGSERIKKEGFTDLGEVIRSVPQNFSGGQNPGVIGAVSGVGNQDMTGGSALNLRGLGADASLTLLNGRRMAYDGFSQAVDISAIPVEAVERLEIIPDGASALYGSDAVGGVANVILKRDFDGVAFSARYGDSSGGGLATRDYTATAGTTWASGGLMASLRWADVDAIDTQQRHYTRHLMTPYSIYGASDTRSGLLTAHQSLGEVAELRIDAFRTVRDMDRYATVPGASYWYAPRTEITVASPSLQVFLPADWSLTFGGRGAGTSTWTVATCCRPQAAHLSRAPATAMRADPMSLARRGHCSRYRQATRGWR